MNTPDQPYGQDKNQQKYRSPDDYRVIAGSGDGSAIVPVAPLVTADDSRHTGAKIYVVISLVVLIFGVVLPFVYLLSLAGQTGSEFIALLFIPLFIAGGLMGIANLFILPRFLIKKTFTGGFKALAIGLFVMSIFIGLFGALQIVGVFASIHTVNKSHDESKKMAQYYSNQEATARSDVGVDEATTMLNSCEVVGFYYTKQDGKNGAENAEASSTGILVYHIPASYGGVTTPSSTDAGKYRMHIADRMVSTMVPIARTAQHTCGIQFWHDGDYEQWKDGHWYFKGALAV
jgi:hypothetical protein